MTDVRSLRPDDLKRFVVAMSGPFGFDLPDEDDQRKALLDRIGKLFEPDRARAAFDGDRMVGTLGVFSFTMTVPGGSIPVAGTTQVTVQPTHRRRGVLSQMMQAHLDEAVAHGDAAAALWASDSAIYGRFGFGIASWSAKIEIDRRHTAFHRLAPHSPPVELVDANDIRPRAIAVYDRVRSAVPGMMSHSDGWWDRIFADMPWNRGGAGRARYALVTENGDATGWAKYRIKDRDEDDGHPSQDVILSQLYAETPGAWSGLWNHVLSHDLGHTIVADLRPVDDPIHSLLAGARRARTLLTDGLWVRLLDVPRALEARSYAMAGTIGITVHDRLGYVSGSYRLESDGTSASVERSDRGSVELDVEDLSALSLGGRSATELAAAGRITGSADAIRTLDRLFRSERAPWSPIIF